MIQIPIKMTHSSLKLTQIAQNITQNGTIKTDIT